MDNKYQRGKIYKIVDNTTDNIYIGSTCEPTLARRLAKHVGDYTHHLKNPKARHPTTSFSLFKNGNYNIILIEQCPCNSKDELFARERHYIELLDCVNKVIPGRTQKEYQKTEKSIAYQTKYIKQWRAENKDKIKECNLKYQVANKQKLKEKALEHFNCFCGGCFTHQHRSRHTYSKLHIKYMKNIEQLLKEGNKQIKLIDDVLNDIQNIKPLKIKTHKMTI